LKGFPIADLADEQAAASRPYLEFLRSESMSVGLYVLPAGGIDGQSPHAEDEIYVVLDGRARFTAGDEARDAVPGDTIFVPAGVPHRFHDIAGDLRVIVVFTPPETSKS